MMQEPIQVRRGRNHGREEQVFLGPEALEDQALRHAGAACDFPGGCGEAFLHECAAGDVEQFIVGYGLVSTHSHSWWHS
jgi:hypothetical protein